MTMPIIFRQNDSSGLRVSRWDNSVSFLLNAVLTPSGHIELCLYLKGEQVNSKSILSAFLQQRGLELDPVAIRLLNDSQLIRLWNAKGELVFYNETMRKVTSYDPLHLCYYDLKTLWRFENEGYDIFKALVAQTLLGRELSKNNKYKVRENLGKGYGALHTVELAVPIFSDSQIAGVLIAGSAELWESPEKAS